jgi:hypothetical protein
MDCTPGSATYGEVEVWVVEEVEEEEEVVVVAVEEVVVEVEMEGMAEEVVAPARTPPVRPSRSLKRILVRHGVIAQSIVTMLLPGPGYLF